MTEKRWSPLQIREYRAAEMDHVCPVWSGLAGGGVAVCGSSGVHKGHCDVADAGGGRQAFVVVGEAARVHESPAFTGSLN